MWKRWAAHAWLNNLPALQKYLKMCDLHKKKEKQKKKARDLLKHLGVVSKGVVLVGGRVIYEHWAAILTILSITAQASTVDTPPRVPEKKPGSKSGGH